MSSAPSTPVLPFAELLDELRRHGFVIGLDQHLRMQQLLDHLAGECPPERLKTHLAPIFATSREEQERFHRIFDRIYPVFAEIEREEQQRHSGHTGELPVPVRSSTRPERRLWIMGAVVILVVLLLVGLWKWLGPSPKVPAPVSQVTVSPNPTPLPTPGADSLAPLDSISTPPPPAKLDRRLPPVQQPTEGFLDRHRTGTRVLLIVLAIGGFLLNEWRLYQRRRLVVSRERRAKPPFTWPVRLESPANPFAQSADLPNAARLLRQREAGEVARLSVEETVTATIAALGFPTFRYRSDTRAPDYLLLIERAAHRDHAARLYQALGRSLEREGVHVTRYLHDGDPRVCYSEDGEQRELLVDLRRRFPDYRVLLFSKGEKLVDQVTGRLQPWTAQFLSWSDRAILTPESPAAWGLREVALAQHFVVLPATTAGLMGVVGHFRGPARPDASRWRALDQDPTVPRLDESDPLPALQTYLGLRVYRWLCACAVYPELHWDLTLHFGGLSIFGPGLISEENLLRLLRLPWFRQGAIPDEIRARLIDELTEAEERAVREAIVELLERNPAPGDSVSANRYELDLVVQRLALNRRNPKQRRAAMRDLAGFPRRELVQDFAMLKLIEETPSSRLQVLLPGRLRRVFYRGGVPLLGVRSGIRAAALAGVIGASLFFTRRGTVESQQDMVIFLQGTYGSPLVVGEQTNVLAFRQVPDSVARYGFNLSTFPDEFTDWSVDRPDILTVDRLGEVVALKPGEAVVTVVSAGHQSRLRVRVEPADLAINRDSVELSPGDVRALKLLVPSQDRELITRGHEGVSWSVSDSTLVRVAPDGVIEALRPGRATVTVNAIRRRASVAVTIGGAPVNQPRIAVDPRRAIDQVVQEYTLAAAAGDIDRMVSLYPSLPKVVRAGYDRLGAARGGIRAKDWKIESAAISRDSARLKMSGSLGLFDGRRAVIWQADLEGITLARRDDRWFITGIQMVRESKNLPPEALAYFSRARMFLEQGNRDRARLYAERALTAYPVYTEAESLLEQLNSVGETTWTEAGSTALTRLDSLRLRAVTGRGTARREYFAAFDSVLLRPTQDLIRGQLLALPSRPEAGADYVRSYNLLKAHLITTGFPLQSSPDFLAPVLTQVWGEAAHPSAYLSRLAATQFAFYAGELQQDKSLVFGASDTLAILRARSFLRQFNGGEQVYSMMLSEAARSGAQPFAFPRLFPSAGQVLVVPHVVPAAFTRQGWSYMEGTVFQHSDRYFPGVDWVLGGEGPDEREHQDLLNSIRSRYRRDYEEQWRQVLAQARIAPYVSLADASRKVRMLAGNPSPLLQLINTVSLNTAMDSGFASTVFQPAQVVSPADSTRLSGPQTAPYLRAMSALGSALEALAAAEPEARKGPGDEAKAQLVAAKNATQALQLSFTVVPGGVGLDITRLLTSGFGSIDAMLDQIGTPGADRGQTPEAASVVLGAGVNSLQVGQTVTLVALARDAKGKALADRTLVWKSRNPLVASVSADGKVTALVDGTAEIVVEVDGISTSQRVTVTSGPRDSTAPNRPGDSITSERARNIPTDALAAYSRALLYQDRDSLQKASDYFRDALRIYPDYTEASQGLTKVVVRQRLNDWTKHLEGRSLAGLLQLYPEMPQKDQQAWKRLLENPSVTRITAVPQGVSVELTGQVEARVRYTLAYSMTVRPSGVQTSVSRYEATFKLVRGAWTITSMQGQP